MGSREKFQNKLVGVQQRCIVLWKTKSVNLWEFWAFMWHKTIQTLFVLFFLSFQTISSIIRVHIDKMRSTLKWGLLCPSCNFFAWVLLTSLCHCSKSADTNSKSITTFCWKKIALMTKFNLIQWESFAAFVTTKSPLGVLRFRPFLFILLHANFYILQ